MTGSHCYCCIFFLTSLFLLTFASPSLQSCLQDQRNALLEFRDEFPSYVSDQTQKTTISSWNNNTDCCSWKGITCDGQSGQVISLTLSSIFLNSSLKHNSALFRLQSLRNLSLSHCNLFGEIPSSLGNLSLLTLLDLSTNSFIGNIPTSFKNFTKLSQLNLSKNQLSGSNFPLILPNLISLTFLNLTYNHFKFTLPPEMNRLRNLESVLLSGNSFSGPFPVFLFAIPALLVVNLEENQFNGALEFSNRSLSSRLQSLYLAHNQFNGLIPESLSQFPNLQMLELSHNNFTGSIPGTISKLLNLYYLGLSNNSLEGEVPSCIWRLKAVSLAQNSFTSFANLSESENETRISEVDLSSNSFQGQFPLWMCKLRSLSILDLSNNLFNGVIPSCLRDSTNSLVQLILRNNSFSGSFPEIFVNGSSLKSLDVSQNQLEGKLPRTLINCRAIEFLNVKSNKFKDKFPFWLGSLTSLHVFILRSNQFHGTLYNPESSIGFKSLRVIDVSNNEFSGDFPSSYFANWHEMATLTDLRDLEPPYMGVEFIWTMYSSVDYGNSMQMVNKGVETEFERILKDYRAIDFSGNRFYGEIPESIGLLKELRLLNLSGNAFTGYIPKSLSNLTNLETLDLSRNQLSGQIPQDLGNLAFLSNMNFSHNLLEGPVPRGTQFQSQNCSSFVNNVGLYGLEEICGEILAPDLSSEQSEEELVMNWIAAAVAYGPGLFCGLVIGYIFTSKKHEWFEEKFSRNKPRAIKSTR